MQEQVVDQIKRLEEDWHALQKGGEDYSSLVHRLVLLMKNMPVDWRSRTDALYLRFSRLYDATSARTVLPQRQSAKMHK